MKICKIKIRARIIISLSILAIIGCGSYGIIISKKEVSVIPKIQYERIIQIYDPEGNPTSLIGIVHVVKGAKICADFPYEKDIKNLDELDESEQRAYRDFTHYVIKDEKTGETFGYASVPAVGYSIDIWKFEGDKNCKYMVHFVLPSDYNGD
jgi:hypothetical protein